MGSVGFPPPGRPSRPGRASRLVTAGPGLAVRLAGKLLRHIGAFLKGIRRSDLRGDEGRDTVARAAPSIAVLAQLPCAFLHRQPLVTPRREISLPDVD